MRKERNGETNFNNKYEHAKKKSVPKLSQTILQLLAR